MNEFLGIFQSDFVKAILDVIFHGFYIVVCSTLYEFYFAGFLRRKIIGIIYIAQFLYRNLVQRRELGQTNARQSNEIFYLHFEAIADNGVFGEICGQRLAFTAIHRRDGGQWAEFHRSLRMK